MKIEKLTYVIGISIIIISISLILGDLLKLDYIYMGILFYILWALVTAFATVWLEAMELKKKGIN